MINLETNQKNQINLSPYKILPIFCAILGMRTSKERSIMAAEFKDISQEIIFTCKVYKQTDSFSI